MSEQAPNEEELKEMIVNYVGRKINCQSDLITVEQVAKVFAKEFPEFLIVLAEENWVNGYTQALKDVDYFKKENTQDTACEQ